MGSAYQIPQQFFPGAPVQKYDEDDSSLDDNVLDQSGADSGLEMSPAMPDSRRDSFAVGGPLFSPKADWPVDMHGSVASGNPFVDHHGNGHHHHGHHGHHSNNPFMRMDHGPAAGVYGTPSAPAAASWSMAGSPLQPFDGGMAYDSHAPGLFARGLPGPAFAGTPMPLFSGLNVAAAAAAAAAAAGATSPQMGKEWMAVQGQAVAKKMMPDLDSPVIRSHNDLRRGDGIRKKNARFDIPVERTLSNIDHLISVCKNDSDLKELKQQKRLLRNRQAALDSRQRKKQHTERLEDEKKHFTAIITELEDEAAELRARVDHLLREQQTTMVHMESMNHEKEEMIRAHTLETGELRKKIGVLSDHIQRIETAGPAAVHQQQHHHQTDGYPCYDDMDGMAAMPGAWDGPFGAFAAVEPEIKQEQPPSPHHHHHHHQQLLPVKRATDLVSADDKQSGPSGLVFMLLLVGAFVLSSRSMPPVHRVSEDVRVASASLLENVLKDAGVGGVAAVAMATAPQPSGATMSAAAWPVASLPDASMSLGDLGDALVQPTQQQANEQLFGLSAAQYNGVTAQDFGHAAPEKSTSVGRRNLADALAAIRGVGRQGGGSGSGSGDYSSTKSLLWDQIPTQVVRDFAKMISECGSGAQGEQQCGGDAGVAV
jgi:hypothetical protein